MKYTFTRCEARVIPEFKGMKNVVKELVIGLTGTDEETGLSAYRDTMYSLPDHDEADFIAFEDIGEDWVKPICEKVATDNDWQLSMVSELEAALTRPVSKLFNFQESNKE